MREILFRGKNKFTGEWCEGFLVKTGDHFRISTQNDLISFGVYPESVGQFTGITDKNEKKIFEGDVVKIGVSYEAGYNSRSVTGAVAYDDIGCIGVIVEYDAGHPVWSDIIYELELSGEIEDYSFEVIGNIHDNPELLKEGAPDGE